MNPRVSLCVCVLNVCLLQLFTLYLMLHFFRENVFVPRIIFSTLTFFGTIFKHFSEL